MACDPVCPAEGLICPEDTGPATDTGVIPDAGDAGMRDTPDVPVAALTCGDNGQVGGHCRAPDNACTAGYPCQDELVGMTGMLTVRTTFNIEQGEPDPTNPGYFREVATPVPANDIPINIATGGFCTAVCDGLVNPPTMMGAPDLDCTDCSSCSATVGVLGLFGTTSILGAASMFGANSGWCRADCVFDPATNGGCPTGYTCSAGENVCIEACTSNTQCQYNLELSRVGLAVTTIDPARATCNTTTGRCDWTSAVEGHVGDMCDAASDCTEDVGICLRGGTCGELQCNRATDTEMGTFGCDLEGTTRNGICLGFGGNNGAICIQGCNSASDCNPGNACLPLGMAAGPYTGYCLGLCDIELNDPDGAGGPMTMADDEIWNCQATERCDVAPSSLEEPDPDGTCRSFCMDDTMCDATLAERCEMVDGATYGFCRVPDQICSVARADADCNFDQVCDLVAFDGNLGLCVNACTDNTDCDAGDECQVARGVCRTPCDSGNPCTPDTAFVCTTGLCEQLTTT